MATYVTTMLRHIAFGGRRRRCYLFADTVEELHRFARGIGCRRWWFHNVRYPHYDLSPTKRHAALQAGALHITAREWIDRHHPRRNKCLIS